jgi:hypothetical protein
MVLELALELALALALALALLTENHTPDKIENCLEPRHHIFHNLRVRAQPREVVMRFRNPNKT